MACAGRIKNVSPVPAQICACFDGAIANAPMLELSILSNTGLHVIPASSVLKIPPEAAPTKHIMGLPGSPTTAIARLPSGPIKRKCNFENRELSYCWENAKTCRSEKNKTS